MWNGHPWQLIAYPSAAHGLCVSITAKDSGEEGKSGALVCSPIVGIARARESKPSPDPRITVLAGGGSETLPAYIAGAVIDEAPVVEVRLGSGDVLRVPTSSGPEPLQHVGFYAVQLPADIRLTPGTAAAFLTSVAGLDARGNVVACLAPHTAQNGISSLSDCR